MMNARQSTAIRRPLWTVGQAEIGRYQTRSAPNVITMLTVTACASAYARNMPVWHASATWRLESAPELSIPPSEWPRRVRRRLQAMLLDLVDGVGRGRPNIVDGRLCLHVRRLLTDHELEVAGDGWKLRKPIDVASTA